MLRHGVCHGWWLTLLCGAQALEAAIELGLPKVEAGAQGEHKISRGYLPSPTYSSHYIVDPTFRSMVSLSVFSTIETEKLVMHGYPAAWIRSSQ